MNRRSFIKNAAVTFAAVGCGGAMGPFAGRVEAGARPLRPPGALDEDAFLSACIRCHRCIDACPNQAILPLDRSFGAVARSTPAVKPRRQACMLCNGTAGDYLKCGEACPTGAIRRIGKDTAAIQAGVAMGIAEIDLDLCYSYNNWSCGACYRACPFPDRAMSLGLWERPTVHDEQCVGCGLCERACIRYPQAIRVKAGASPRLAREATA